jgi:pyridoxamine 5'-phosphate oxidase
MEFADASKLSLLRQDYGKGELVESKVDADAIVQFSRWLDEAVAAKLPDPNAMILATADAKGKPSARVMLLKEFDSRGFVFYTNYLSRKGGELESNPRAALVFFWQTLERQVRIEGTIGLVSRRESEEYFHSRPRAAQIGAWVSRQSGAISSRKELDELAGQITAKYANTEVPLPDYWGGYRLTPQSIEFWQGRPDRLHDRLLYSLEPDGKWKIQRLSP